MEYDLVKRRSLSAEAAGPSTGVVQTQAKPFRPSYKIKTSHGENESEEPKGLTKRTFITTTRDYTDEEIADLLQGYISVPKRYYERIKERMHVRWYGTDGKFRRGAFVKNIHTRDGERYIQLETEYDPKKKSGKTYKTFGVAFKDIDKLYKKIDSRAYLEVDLISIQLRSMVKRIDQLEQKVEQLEKKS